MASPESTKIGTRPVGPPDMDISEKGQPQEVGMKEDLDSRRSPPRNLKDVFKRYSRATVSPEDLAQVSDSACLGEPEWSLQNELSEDVLQKLFERFQDGDSIRSTPPLAGFRSPMCSASIYQSNVIPGLTIIPSLLPTNVQWTLLSRLFLRDLSKPCHKTNLNLHYNIQYPEAGDSFFAYPLHCVAFTPKKPDMHPCLDMDRVLSKKLRWITLGGQYDWTNKVYPEESPPVFPEDIADLLKGVFDDMDPQAAIVNLYSSGDTLSLHRDVSEEINRGLVSISLGCDGLFIIGLRDSSNPLDPGASRYHTLRLHSGDAVYMSGNARYAWHGVPKIMPRTSPQFLQNWPGDPFTHWRDNGFMVNKRVNLNVRQMRDISGSGEESSKAAVDQHLQRSC